jgi:ElaB/YqjD/DUF883 family membrane-anchored ribosome-binding protein
MASLLKALTDCLTGADEPTASYPTEKQLLPNDLRTAEEMAEQVVQAMLSAEKGGKELRRTLDAIVGEYGWTEKVAEWTLARLEDALREVSKLGPVLKEAYDKAWEAAEAVEGFVKEHPVFCTVVALGVLVIIAPWVIEALGFGELGPIEGMYGFHRKVVLLITMFRVLCCGVAVSLCWICPCWLPLLLLPAAWNGMAFIGRRIILSYWAQDTRRRVLLDCSMLCRL